MRRWRPLSVRDVDHDPDFDEPHEGVPPWLERSLALWLARGFVKSAGGETRGHVVPFVTMMERLLRRRLPESIGELVRLAQDDDDTMLDFIDFILGGTQGTFDGRQLADELQHLLREGGSVWTVGEHVGVNALVRRLTPEAEDGARRTVEASPPTVADHLRMAWHEVYGRDPNPSHGYREAVKAVEVAAIPIVTPKDNQATLGKIISAMRAKPSKWGFALRPSDQVEAVEQVIEVMDLLWKGQRDRHGVPERQPVMTQPEAEAGLHLALTLVQWFTSGGVWLRNENDAPRPKPEGAV